MKRIIVLTISLLSAAPVLATQCKTGDLADCGTVLRKVHKKNQDADFAKVYDTVCAENKKFKCIKKIVRGDVNEEMKFTAEEHPKAHLYTVKEDGEKKIFILEER